MISHRRDNLKSHKYTVPSECVLKNWAVQHVNRFGFYIEYGKTKYSEVNSNEHFKNSNCSQFRHE
jgi:hypothetical protein